jgi:hypothetical protein
METGKGQLLGAGAAADHIGSFDDEHAPATHGELDGGGQSIGTGTHHDGIEMPLREFFYGYDIVYVAGT